MTDNEKSERFFKAFTPEAQAQLALVMNYLGKAELHFKNREVYPKYGVERLVGHLRTLHSELARNGLEYPEYT